MLPCWIIIKTNHVVPNLYNLLYSVEHNRRYFEKCLCFFVHTVKVGWVQCCLNLNILQNNFFYTHTGLELVWVNNDSIFTFVWTTFKLWMQLCPDATFITHCFSTDCLIELGRIQPTVTRVVTVPASYTGESLILYLNLSAWPTFLYWLNY